jgi:hypothetical protein
MHGTNTSSIHTSMASTPTKKYSSGLLDDFHSAKRTWKPKTPTSIKSKAKSADAELPSLFANAVSRSPRRRKANTTTVVSTVEKDRTSSDLYAPSDSWIRDRQMTKGSKELAQVTPFSLSDESIAVPSLFKTAVPPSSSRRSPSPVSPRTTTTLSPGKYKSQSAKVIVKKKKKVSREPSPKRPASATWSSKDSNTTGSSLESNTSDPAQSGLPRLSPTKSKIKIISRTFKTKNKESPEEEGRDEVTTVISDKSGTTPSSFNAMTMPNTGKVVRAENNSNNGEPKQLASFKLSREKDIQNGDRQHASPKHQPANIKLLYTARNDPRDDDDQTDVSSKQKQGLYSNKKDTGLGDRQFTEKRNGTSTAPKISSTSRINEASISFPDAPLSKSKKELDLPLEESNIRSQPLSPAINVQGPLTVRQTSITASPRKVTKYTGHISAIPRSKNKVMAITPEKCNWLSTKQLTPNATATTATPAGVLPIKPRVSPLKYIDNNEGIHENNSKEKVPLVSIDNTGTNPQMIISFDTDDYNPIDEDELSCSVATEMFGSSSPSRKFSVKAAGALAPSDPEAIVSLLSQEEQLELFKTLEKLHRNMNKI